MTKVGILGASGYAGAELVRLLSQREDVELAFLHSNSHAEIPFAKRYPNLRTITDLDFVAVNLDAAPDYSGIDILFCALPHGQSQKVVQQALSQGVRVIDLSADFRLQDAEVYESWYGVEHQAQTELLEAVYGLPEMNREQIKQANLVANPGCYPTSALLGLYPLLKAGYGTKASIIVDSKSGVSGGGRGLKDGNLYTQVTESIHPYAVGTHRHTPEITEQLTAISGEPASLIFVPHLVPMQRGILSTIYVQNEHQLAEEDLLNLYSQHYGEEYFIRTLDGGETPQTKAVSGSNFCDVALKVDEATNTIVIMAVIDNLIKGASGQAIQNMNLMLGLEETKGLTQAPMWP